MRNLLLSLLFVIISTSAFSQRVAFGIFAEPMISWMKPDITNVSYSSVKPGINVGLMSDFYFTKNYAFATGISICNTGGKLLFNAPAKIATKDGGDSIGINSNDNILTYKLQYVEVPIGLKMKTNPIGMVDFFANVGLTPQINIKAIGKSLSILDENIRDGEINLFNLGYHFGGGVELHLGGSSFLSIGVIYKNGFLDVTKDTNRDPDKTTLSSVSLKIGVIF